MYSCLNPAAITAVVTLLSLPGEVAGLREESPPAAQRNRQQRVPRSAVAQQTPSFFAELLFGDGGQIWVPIREELRFRYVPRGEADSSLS